MSEKLRIVVMHRHIPIGKSIKNMVPAIFPKKFRSESVLARSNIRTSTIGTVNNRAIRKK